jgi:hypothetical protein
MNIFRSAIASWCILLVGAVGALATIPMQEFTTVDGKVTDENGEPLPGATVVAIGQGPAISVPDDGSFQLLLPSGKISILVWHVGYGTFKGEMDLAVWIHQVEVDIVLKKGQDDLGSVVGKVEGMLGSTDWRVELPELGLTASCDLEGNFDFEEVPAGQWRAVAYCNHFTPQIMESVSVTAGETRELSFKFIKY